MSHHDPSAEFRAALVATLSLDPWLSQEKAKELADAIAKRYFHLEDVGGPHFELLNITVQWSDLCGDAVEGKNGLSDVRVGALAVAGALRWFDSMRWFHTKAVPPIHERGTPYEAPDYGPVEAAVCLGLWQEARQSRSLIDPESFKESLLAKVNALLGRVEVAAIDRARQKEAVDRLLHGARCLQPKHGWYGLRDEMPFQVAEE